MHSVRCEGAVGRRHAERVDCVGPQNRGVDRLEVCANAHVAGGLDYRLGPDLEDQLGVHDVHAVDRCLEQREVLAEVAALVVVDNPGLAVVGVRKRHLRPCLVTLGQGNALLHSGGKGEWLERGARLPAGSCGDAVCLLGGKADAWLGQDCQVQLGEAVLALGEVVAAPHHGPDVTVVGVDGDQRAVRVGLVGKHPVDRFLGRPLHAEVDRGVDAQPPLEQPPGSLPRRCPQHLEARVVGDELLDVVHEVRSGIPVRVHEGLQA